jgi:hypothetical protein
MLQAVAKKPYPTAIPGDLIVDNFIVTFISRALIYPVLAPFYTGLNDLLSLVFFLALVGVVIWSIVSGWRLPFSDTTLPLAVALIVTLGITILTRPGLSAFISSYDTTYPDRYFMGINLLFLLLLILSITHIRPYVGKLVNTLIIASATTIVLFNAVMFTDFDKPWGPIATSESHLSRLCNAEVIDGSNSRVKIEPAKSFMTVPSSALQGLKC